ncbi:MAG: hypothetical protein GWN58_27715 [Anaerolineae bacterium]|nr:hypothetical protein [Anaerolineae bacterium]
MSVLPMRIQNAMLEAPFTMRVDPETGSLAPEILVPEGWDFYYVPQGPNDPAWKNRRPEWVPFDHYAKMFVTSGTMVAGLMQRYEVDPGEVFSLNVGACFTSENAGIALRVGLDPLGGTDFRAESIVWGPWQGETAQGPEHWLGGLDNPRTLVVPQVEVPGTHITMFLHAQNDWAGKDASAFWDWVCLNKHNGDQEPPGGGDLDELVAAVKDVAAAIRELIS